MNEIKTIDDLIYWIKFRTDLLQYLDTLVESYLHKKVVLGQINILADALEKAQELKDNIEKKNDK